VRRLLKLRGPILSVVIAISIGFIVLLSYFFDIPVLQSLRFVFMEWAVILAAVALLIGLINLLSVHLNKVGEGGVTRVYSAVLGLALIGTFLLTLVLGLDNAWPQFIFTYIQVPIEASLMAALAISLAYACARLLQRRTNLLSIIFVITALIVLLGTGTFLGFDIPWISDTLRPWLSQVPAAAGARGILLGVGLGTVATGLRILVGTDRPYGG
jgi:hypothetical protein